MAEALRITAQFPGGVGFMFEANGERYAVPRAMAEEELLRLLEAVCALLAVVCDHVPEETIAAWDLNSKTASIVMTLLPRPKPLGPGDRPRIDTGGLANVIAFPTGAA